MIDADRIAELRRLEAEAEESTRQLKEAVEKGGYEILADGSVYSCRHNWRGYGKRKLKHSLNSDGYSSVRLSVDGRRIHLPVHRLVAAYHLPPRPSMKHEVRHKNGIRTDPRAENLEWGTPAENAADRAKHGNTAIGRRNGFARVSDDARLSMAYDTRPLVTIAREHGIDPTTVALIKASAKERKGFFSFHAPLPPHGGGDVG